MTHATMQHHLHFTFSPVQSFVAQARRTRDLYAGSLLLSHLAMSAMRAIRDARDKIILPNFAELSKLEAMTEHATAPNRFVAAFDSETAAAEAGRAAEGALRAAWRKIADAVWESHLQKHVALGHGTAEIWQRQVENFWNIAWVVGDAKETNWLDRRKNWQTHWPPEEGGDHCALMGQWQELSGFIRSKQKREQDAFWQAVGAGDSNPNLEPGERLCATAFIKRFFPAVAERAIGRKLDPRGWPSTVTIAALPWMRNVAASPVAQAKAQEYAELVRGEPGAIMASAHHIRFLKEFPAAAGDFAKLSGNFLNRTALANKDDTPLRPGTDRDGLLKQLRKLEDATGDRAGNFYAVLLMDGDSMGALIRNYGPEKVTSALTKFATHAPETVKALDGITIYAGGDDLLALLPLDRVLNAAVAVHQFYRDSFGREIKDATVSAAIVFAHYRYTFSRVLASAHELLDDVAKDRTGRDALAIRLLKPGGLTGEWSAPFDHLMKTKPDKPHLFAPLVESFGERKPLTSSLLYNLRERFSQLTEGDEARVDSTQLHKLFTAEALIGKRDLDDTTGKLEATQAVMSQFLDVCEVMRRNPDTKLTESTGRFTFNGARLVKFLALDGKEGAQ